MGRRLRELRTAAGMSQAGLAGRRYSHATVSNIERAKRAPSLAAIDYFAHRLGVPVEAIWDEAGVTWVIDMARELNAQDRSDEARELLIKTLRNLERGVEPRRQVVVALHRELAIILEDDTEGVRAHLLAALEVAGDDDSLLGERAHLHAELGHLAAADQRSDDALHHYQTALSLFKEFVAEQTRLRSTIAARVQDEE